MLSINIFLFHAEAQKRRGAERGTCGVGGKGRLKTAHFDFE
jgi:hypothetical protein